MTLRKKILIVSILYFAEGFPFGLIEQTFPVYFRLNGMSLEHIGLLSLLSLPYALKFFWSPAVDFIGTRRRWITAAQFSMAGLVCLLIWLDPASPTTFFWACLLTLAVMSATQDIAVDAYSIEMLSPSELGLANGFRQAAYRVAMVTAGGLFVVIGGTKGWTGAFLLASATLVICGFVSLTLPAIEASRPTRSTHTGRRPFAELVSPLMELITRPGAVGVAMFILFYKLGDMALGRMVMPFWLSVGLSTTDIGLITGTFGVAASICGGLAGGLFMARYGIFPGLWFLGALQSISNLAYVWAAFQERPPHELIYIASIAESFCGGLGTAAFLAFLMSICRKEFSATQYALISALFRITGIAAQSLSGWATSHTGYAHYFLITFGLSLPAFFFIFCAQRWIPPDTAASSTPRA